MLLKQAGVAFLWRQYGQVTVNCDEKRQGFNKKAAVHQERGSEQTAKGGTLVWFHQLLAAINPGGRC